MSTIIANDGTEIYSQGVRVPLHFGKGQVSSIGEIVKWKPIPA